MLLNSNAVRSSLSNYAEAARHRYNQAVRDEWAQFASVETPVTGNDEYSLNLYREGEHIGYLILKPEAEGLCLKLFSVNEHWQQAGVERHMLAFAERHALEKGAPRLIVFAPRVGIPYFVRHGFQQTGDFLQDSVEGIHFFRMEKDLA